MRFSVERRAAPSARSPSTQVRVGVALVSRRNLPAASQQPWDYRQPVLANLSHKTTRCNLSAELISSSPVG